MSIVYTFSDNLYINLTNRCTCACTFCIRTKKDQVGSADTLWLSEEPTIEEIKAALNAYDLSAFEQIVFCGYGEPTERLDVLLETARYLKSVTKTPLRLNTNGLSDLSHGTDTAALLDGLIDSISISMNAADSEKYLALTRSQFGLPSFEAMLRFTENCKQHVAKVRLSIVDLLSPHEIATCKAISERIGVPLLIRPYEEA